MSVYSSARGVSKGPCCERTDSEDRDRADHRRRATDVRDQKSCDRCHIGTVRQDLGKDQNEVTSKKGPSRVEQ